MLFHPGIDVYTADFCYNIQPNDLVIFALFQLNSCHYIFLRAFQLSIVISLPLWIIKYQYFEKNILMQHTG